MLVFSYMQCHREISVSLVDNHTSVDLATCGTCFVLLIMATTAHLSYWLSLPLEYYVIAKVACSTPHEPPEDY